MVASLHEGPLAVPEPAWWRLHAADPQATPFTSPGWILPWWRHYGGGRTALTVAVSDGGELVGLAPLAVGRRGPLRMAIGAGTTVGGHWAVLALPERRADVVALVARTLREHASAWDLLSLDRVPSGAPLPDALAATGLRTLRRRGTPAPVIPLPGSTDAWLAGRPKGDRKELRRALRRVDAGEVVLHDVQQPDVADAVGHWHTLRQRWWAERGRQIRADHRGDHLARFATEAMEALTPRGLARVMELRRHGERVGISLNLIDDRAFYAWMDAFEPRLAPLSPGHLTVAATVRESIEAGRAEYDLLIGAEPYKFRYGAQRRVLPWIVAAHGRPASRLAIAAIAALDRVRGRA